MSQTFDTVTGQTYNVDYFLTTQQLGGVPPIEVADVAALNGLVILNSVSNSFNPMAGVWIPGATLSFVAASTSTTLRFTDSTTPANSGPVNWGLDGITVNGATSGVPEPGSYALMLLGLGAVALRWKRRSSV